MTRRKHKYTDDVLQYVKDNAGAIPSEDICAKLNVNMMALQKQCVIWRKDGHEIPSLKKSDAEGTIKIREKLGENFKVIKASGRWVRLNRHNYEVHIGTIPPYHNIGFRDGNPMNCEPENLYAVPIHRAIVEKRVSRPKKEKPAKSIKPKIFIVRNTVKQKAGGPSTSNKRKPGTDANWTQKHLAAEKKMVIPPPPSGNGIRLDSRTTVYPKNPNAKIMDLQKKYCRNLDKIKESVSSVQ